MRKNIARLFIVLVLCISVFASNLLFYKPFSINHFFEREFIRFGLQNPEVMSQLGLLDGTPLDFYNDDLDDASIAQVDRGIALAKHALETMRRYDRGRLSPDAQLSYDMFEYFLADRAEGERWKLHGYAIMQNEGVYLDIVDFMSRVHRINTLKDAKNYITRMHQVSRKMLQSLDLAKLQSAGGITPPAFIIDKTLDNLHNIRNTPIDESPFVASFIRRMAEVPAIPEEARNALAAEARTILTESIYPAYDTTIATLEAMRETATDDAGAWKLPDGDGYYQYCIKSSTTSKMTAEEIHQLGLAEVARIEAEMDAILIAQGYTDGTLSERLQVLDDEERFLRPNTDEGKEEIVAEYQVILDEINTGIRTAFHRVPRARLEVRRIPEYREATAATHYNAASLDGSRPAIFFAKLQNVHPRWRMRSLAYHEGVPGHHFQIGLQGEMTGVPTFRKVLPFNAFAEGWALYAERLAWEMGYQADPFDNLGRLAAEHFRAVRLVVDTGLHYKRWTRQQTLDYMLEHTGSPNESEVDRYCVWPGQALAYKVGMLKILELREKAKTELGEKFDIRDFHQVVIGNGSLPLSILENQVAQYIAGKKTA